MEKTSEDVAYLITFARIWNSDPFVYSSEFMTRRGAGIGDDQGSRPTMNFRKCQRKSSDERRTSCTLNGGIER